jgi:serine/threonine-protein kinase SRPK3
MNGGDIKKAAIHKAKQMASVANNAANNAANPAANGSGGKKRRKGTDLKPIITNEGPQPIDVEVAGVSSQG